MGSVKIQAKPYASIEKINSSVNILLQPVGGHNRYLSTSCVMNLSADSSLSLAVLHLQLTGVETVAVTISDNTTNITEYPHLFPGNNYVDYGPMDLLHLDTVTTSTQSIFSRPHSQ